MGLCEVSYDILSQGPTLFLLVESRTELWYSVSSYLLVLYF